MNNLTTFDFNSLSIRVVEREGEPWFVAADVCKALGITAVKYAYDRIGAAEKTYVGRTDLGLSPGKPMVIISESGLYKLVMRSDKPEAQAARNIAKLIENETRETN